MNIKKFIGTSFGTAYLIPKMPGTSSSIFIWIFLCAFKDIFTLNICLGLSLIFIALGVYAIDGFEEKDPAFFTLDESAAILILFPFCHQSIFMCIFSITLFRLFDIFKPLGIKRSERWLPSSRVFSIYIDDFIAASYTLFFSLIVEQI